MAAKTLTQRLEDLQDIVDNAQKELDRAEGALQASMKRLQDEFNLSSLEEANKKVESMTIVISDLREKLEKQVSELETELNEA